MLRPLLGTSGALAAAILLWLKRVADSPPPTGSPEFAKERAQRVARHFVRFLQRTPTFDQLISGLRVESVDATGIARVSIRASGAMLTERCGSAPRRVHEGALMLLVDDITAMAMQVVGRAGGVSMELSLNMVRPVLAGEVLTAVARVLRAGRTTAFLKIEFRDAAGHVVGIGSHLKHLGLPFLWRLLLALAARFPWFARWLHRRHMELLKHTIEKFQLKKVDEDSMEQVLDLKRSEDASADGSARFDTVLRYPLLNPSRSGHGASSAALIAAAVRAHLWPKAAKDSTYVDIHDMSVSYLDPVPEGKPVDVLVTPVSKASNLYVAELRSKQGRLLVRGRVTATVRQAR